VRTAGGRTDERGIRAATDGPNGCLGVWRLSLITVVRHIHYQRGSATPPLLTRCAAERRGSLAARRRRSSGASSVPLSCWRTAASPSTVHYLRRRQSEIMEGATISYSSTVNDQRLCFGITFRTFACHTIPRSYSYSISSLRRTVYSSAHSWFCNLPSLSACRATRSACIARAALPLVANPWRPLGGRTAAWTHCRGRQLWWRRAHAVNRGTSVRHSTPSSRWHYMPCFAPQHAYRLRNRFLRVPAKAAKTAAGAGSWNQAGWRLDGRLPRKKMRKKKTADGWANENIAWSRRTGYLRLLLLPDALRRVPQRCRVWLCLHQARRHLPLDW